MIKITNFSCIYSDDFRVECSDISIKRGETLYIVGPSGSGKSTFLHSLVGFEDRANFKLTCDDKIIEAKSKIAAAKSIHMMIMTQELGLWSHMNALEHILFVIQSNKAEEAQEWLAKVGLKHKVHSKPKDLSGGEKQRLALARALATNPHYLLLDEPFAALDVVYASELLELIKNEQKKMNFGLINVSHHYLGIQHNSNIIVFNSGIIAQQGIFQDILEKPKNKWIEQWVKILSSY